MSKIGSLFATLRTGGVMAVVRLLQTHARLARAGGGAAVFEELKRQNDFFYTELGVSVDQVRKLWKETAAKAGIEVRDGDSMHRFYFAALAAGGFEPKTMLELGTHHGGTTAFIATLWPNATLYTVELPDTDPLYKKFHPEGTPRRTGKASQILARENIRQLKINTMDILEQDLPTFDFIWLDAGHHFPEVAWDHFYCMSRLNVGGWLLTDDVKLPNNPLVRRDPGHMDVYSVVDYFNERRVDKIRLLAKRLNPSDYVNNPKFIGCLHKTVPLAPAQIYGADPS